MKGVVSVALAFLAAGSLCAGDAAQFFPRTTEGPPPLFRVAQFSYGALTLADFGLTRHALSHGGRELNPLVRWRFKNDAVAAVTFAADAILVPWMCGKIWRIDKRRGRRIMAFLLIFKAAVVAVDIHTSVRAFG